MTFPGGRLIVFEGPEGAGKTTQLRLLCDWLDARGRAYTGVREPGGTALGNEIRQILLEPAQGIAPAAEALLFMASRAQLLADVVNPALARGEVVLADRFFLSTYAYQVAGRGLPFDAVRAANALATGELVPALTIVLALPESVRSARTAARGGPDRIEGAGIAFHDRVERAFAEFASPSWQAAHPECGPIVTVNADGGERDVHDRVINVLATRMSDTFAMRNAAHT